RDFTVIPQPLDIGPGIRNAPVFSVVQYGDYGRSQPGGTLFDAAESVSARLDRARKLGVNMFVDRVDVGLVDEKLTIHDLAPRLSSDPGAVAMEKATIEGAGRQTIAGYGASGIEQRAILLMMDASLPTGTGFDPRTAQQLAWTIGHVTQGLSPYPAFRGWSWAANWWPAKVGADAAASPEERALYVGARQAAIATGSW